jgi:hypothetical protein
MRSDTASVWRNDEGNLFVMTSELYESGESLILNAESFIFLILSK